MEGGMVRRASDTQRPVLARSAAHLVVLTTFLLALLAALVAFGVADYLAFHSIIEFLVASAALAIFTIAWHTRRVADDDFMTMLGITQLFVACTTALHALTYKGVVVFSLATVTMGTQFWIVTRATQAIGLVAATAFIGRRMKRPGLTVIACGLPVVAACAAIFMGAFPVTFVDGNGLTPFKIDVEWVIIATLVLALVLLWRKRERFKAAVFTDLALAIGFMIGAEVVFTAYASLFDIFNVVGHILHLASIYFVYRALVAESLEDPFGLLFHTLALREEALREEHRLSEGLNRIVAAIGSSLNVDDIMRAAIVEAAAVAGADGAAISILSDGLFQVRYTHGQPTDRGLGLFLDRSEAPHLFLASELGEPVVIPDMSADHRADGLANRVGIRSLLSIPLANRGEPSGVMSLHWREPTEAVTSPSLQRFAHKLGAAMSLALANAKLYESEYRVAKILQDAMAKSPETVVDVEVGSAYRPAPGRGRIGGDFFDVFAVDKGRVAFVLGDVCGHGIEAAATNALTRSSMRALAYRNPDPARVMASANDTLLRQLGDDEFVTAAFGVLDTTTLEVAISVAGHPDPMVCGRPHLVPDPILRSVPLAVVPDATFDVWRFKMLPGETLVLFSDGLCEARRGSEQFGITRVRAFIESCSNRSCQEMADELLAAADRFAVGSLHDDVAILALRPATA
jgi:serine phosphatase RsbU (regulator of sigma subunit)